MKRLKVITLVYLSIFFLAACGSSNAEANADGFTKIQEDIESEFGEEAYYTDISISYDNSIGNMISVTVAQDPESLGMQEWLKKQGFWEQTADVTIEIPEGTRATDFMFQLDDRINLTKLGELVEKSQEQLKTEKGLDEMQLDIAYINFPDDGDYSKAKYYISLEPKTGGTSFDFYYTLQGELLDMNY